MSFFFPPWGNTGAATTVEDVINVTDDVLIGQVEDQEIAPRALTILNLASSAGNLLVSFVDGDEFPLVLVPGQSYRMEPCGLEQITVKAASTASYAWTAEAGGVN